MNIKKILKIGLMWEKFVHGKSYMKVYNSYLKACGMKIDGTIKFIHSSVYIDVGYAPHIHIGNNCVLSVNTVVLAHDFSLECGMNSIGLGDLNDEKKIVNDVHIGQNVFVGAGCIILPGTHIGNNCIIGAGTVCAGYIPENSVIVGEKWKKMAETTEWAKQKIQEYDIFI